MRVSEGDPPLVAKPDDVGNSEARKMTDAKNKIAVLLKRRLTRVVSEVLNVAGHPLARDILVIYEECVALTCERRC